MRKRSDYKGRFERTARSHVGFGVHRKRKLEKMEETRSPLLRLFKDIDHMSLFSWFYEDILKSFQSDLGRKGRYPLHQS